MKTKERNLARLVRGGGRKTAKPQARTVQTSKARKPPAQAVPGDQAWLWPAYASLQGEVGAAESWDDPTVPNHTRALLLRYVAGVEAFGIWSANKVPPCPSWFTTWPAALQRLQADVDALAMTWADLEEQVKVGEKVRMTLNLYQVEIVLDPAHPLYQTRGLPPQNAYERQRLRALQATLDRLGQLDPLHVVPERGPRSKSTSPLQARLLVNAGRQRTKALRQHNLDTIVAWWKPLTWLSVTRAEPPQLRLEVACVVTRRPMTELLQEAAALNATPRRPSKLEQLEEALRLKANKVPIAQIGEAMGGLSKSSVHNLLSLERLHETLLPLVWDETMPLAVAYELVRHPQERQLILWSGIRDKSDKLAALRELLATAEARPRPAVTTPPRMLNLQTLRSASEPLRARPEFASHLDLVEALLGDAAARARLPDELQGLVAATVGT